MAKSTTQVNAKQELSKILNHQIANWTVLYTKIHNFHWYVKGESFFTLHVKFEELYNEAALNLDEIAERLLAIGGNPVATLKEALAEASVKEATGKEDASGMVQSLVNDYTMIVEELDKGMELAEELGDDTTADMLLKIHESLEKHNWMLSSFLGKKQG